MISETEKGTQAVVGHHLQAMTVDDILTDYSEDSVLFTADGPVRGLAGVRAFFEAFTKSITPEIMVAYKLVRMDVVGETAYILWKAEPFVLLGTDTFVVHSGKIVAQSFTGYMPAESHP